MPNMPTNLPTYIYSVLEIPHRARRMYNDFAADNGLQLAKNKKAKTFLITQINSCKKTGRQEKIPRKNVTPL